MTMTIRMRGLAAFAGAQPVIVSPDPGVAVNVTVPVPQRVLPDAEGAEGKLLIVAVTAVLAAETQPVVVFLVSA